MDPALPLGRCPYQDQDWVRAAGQCWEEEEEEEEDPVLPAQVAVTDTADWGLKQ